MSGEEAKRPSSSQALVLSKTQQNADLSALEVRSLDLPIHLADDEVLIMMLAAAIHPADFLLMKGFFGKFENFPLGLDGVGSVVEAGSGVTGLNLGDWVAPAISLAGTWRTFAVFKENQLARIEKKLGLQSAAMQYVNPSTAYCLLTSVVQLKPGDTVLQNGANSAIGLLLVQIARHLGIRTVNVVRQRQTLNELKDKLVRLGGDVVVTYDELQQRGNADPWTGDLANPRLAIDCVGGSAGGELLRHLEDGGTLIHYGNMTGQPLLIDTATLLTKNLQVRSFALHRCTTTLNLRENVFPFITNLMLQGKLKDQDCKLYKFSQYKAALEEALSEKKDKKILLVFDAATSE